MAKPRVYIKPLAGGDPELVDVPEVPRSGDRIGWQDHLWAVQWLAWRYRPVGESWDEVDEAVTVMVERVYPDG